MTNEEQDVGTVGRDPAVFFSYSRVNLKQAQPVIALLEGQGFSVWWDGKLEAGSRYIEMTEQALDTASAVVVAWTEQSISSHWVRDEATSGRDTNRLIPISLDGSFPPLGFRQFQVLDFSNWKGDPAAEVAVELVNAVHALEGAESQAPTGSTQKIKMPGANRRQALIYAGIGAGVLAVGGSAFALFNQSSAPDAARNSIAVLPFANDSNDPDQDYITVGVAAELRSKLSRNPALKIVARSSSEVVAQRGLGAVAAAKELGVAFIVEGSAQLVNGVVRVSSDLIDGETGIGTWSQKFSKPLDGMLELQQELAEQISQALSLEVSMAEGDLQLGQATVPAAYNEYLRGWDAFANAVDTGTLEQALRHFQTAARLDPQFAGAKSGEAAAFLSLGHGANSAADADRNYQSATTSARQAVKLGPDLAEAYAVLGQTLFEAQLKIDEAREPYERSLELGRGIAANQSRYAEYMALTGGDQAASEAAKLAVELDPLNPSIFKAAALVDYSAGRFKQAIDWQRKALKLNPQIGGSHSWIGSALIQLGRPREALTHCEAEPSVLLGQACLAIAQNAVGDQAAAKAAKATLVRRYGDAAAYQLAQVSAQWGEADAAMEKLQLARRLGDAGLTYLRMDPMLDPLRQRPDFLLLQRELGYRSAGS